MLCQTKKRIEWQIRISNRLLDVPYAHITFTLPEDLRNLAKANPRHIYNILFRTAWATIKTVGKNKSNIGALPGMLAVLHTFGSDLKYHVHVHCLVTFGGFDKDNKWINPKRNDRIAGFRELRNTYKKLFLQSLKQLYQADLIDYHLDYDQVTCGVKDKTWVVNHQPPVMDTQRIENYLSKYICRTAITPSRLHYNPQKQIVELIHKNYEKQITGKPAPLEIKHLAPLDVLHMIVQHKLPFGFHKSRYYGIHSSSTFKKVKTLIPQNHIRDKRTIKQLLSILKFVEYLLGLPDSSIIRCKDCGSENLIKTIVCPDKNWPKKNIRNYTIPRSPPKIKSHRIGIKKQKIAFA